MYITDFDRFQKLKLFFLNTKWLTEGKLCISEHMFIGNNFPHFGS